VSDLLSICENLRRWFQKNNYKGIDLYLLDEKVFSCSKRLAFLRYIRKILKCFHSHIPPAIFSSFSSIYLPKALGLIIGGNCSFWLEHRKNNG